MSANAFPAGFYRSKKNSALEPCHGEKYKEGLDVSLSIIRYTLFA